MSQKMGFVPEPRLMESFELYHKRLALYLKRDEEQFKCSEKLILPQKSIDQLCKQFNIELVENTVDFELNLSI